MDKVPEEFLFSIRGLIKKFPIGYTSSFPKSPGQEKSDNFKALDGIDLDISSGECLLIAGANGSGKTLLTRILAGLLVPTEGQCLYRGKPLKECKKIIRSQVGLVFQDAQAQILGETVEEDIRFGPENLKLPKEEIERLIEETLCSLELTAKRDFPARHLSGGEKRRLGVAGVLAMGCETIIMDEPFANLDWPGVKQVLEIIQVLKQRKKTIVILTHELEKVLSLADRLVILVAGRIKDSGEPEEVLNRLDPAWGVRDPRGAYSLSFPPTRELP